MHEQNVTLSRAVGLPVVRTGSYKLVTVSLALIAALLFGELLLWSFLPPQDRYFVWPPRFESTLHPNPELLPGIDGEAHFTINSYGIRGDEIGRGEAYRILAVGGSTTECLYLDQAEVWTHLLQEKLSQAKEKAIWVGNAGRSGRNTRHHLLQMKYLIPQFPKIDAVVVLAGVNDLHIRISDLEYDPRTTAAPSFEEDYMRAAFAVSPPALPAFHYKRLGWWRMVKKVRAAFLADAKGQPIQDATGGTLVQWRRYRKNAEEIVDEVPDLTAALGEYRRNLEAMADLSRRYSVRLFLVTQPTIWRPDLSAEEMDLLWMGGVGSFQLGKGHKYYSVSALETIMQQYNAVVLDVCRTQGIDCIDLAGALPKDRTVFYDDVHFNETGAAQVAQVMYEQMASQVP